MTSCSAIEICRDGSFRRVQMRFAKNRVFRDGELYLELSGEYRLLKTVAFGLCGTDLARPHLPFALPESFGHEVVARDEASGALYALEINASHRATASAPAADCAYCASEALNIHCPRRCTLGIDRLLGGSSSRLLAPARALTPLPAALADDTVALGVMLEPFAAALKAARAVALKPRDTVAVLGGRGRLGRLLVAALAADGVVARALSRQDIDDDDDARFDVVFDASGSAGGFERAVRLARRELHVKSTSGAGGGRHGLARLTAFVVDELRLERYSAPRLAAAVARCGGGDGDIAVAWLSALPPPAAVAARIERGDDARALFDRFSARAPLYSAPICVVDTFAQVDQVIRPYATSQSTSTSGAINTSSSSFMPSHMRALVTPRGLILCTAPPPAFAPLVVSSSRCGAFAPALALMASNVQLRRDLLAKDVVLRRFLIEHDDSNALAVVKDAFEAAREKATKVIIEYKD